MKQMRFRMLRAAAATLMAVLLAAGSLAEPALYRGARADDGPDALFVMETDPMQPPAETESPAQQASIATEDGSDWLMNNPAEAGSNWLVSDPVEGLSIFPAGGPPSGNNEPDKEPKEDPEALTAAADGLSPRAEVLPRAILPGPPQNVTLSSPGSVDLTVTFSPPADDGGGAIYEYRIRLAMAESEAGSISTLTNTTSHTFTMMPPGLYTAYVQAFNEEGGGPEAASNMFLLDTSIISISLSVTEPYTFPNVREGYTSTQTLQIWVNNTGTQATGPISIALSNSGETFFVVLPDAIPGGIPYGGSGPITFTPRLGLAAGQYDTTVTASCPGSSTAILLRFTVLVPPVVLPVPSASIDYINEMLTGLDAGAVYTVDGVGYLADAGGALAIPEGWMNGASHAIVRKGDGENYADSPAQNLVIPRRPNAPPGPAGVDCTTPQNGDGRIIGLTSSMEIGVNGTSWTDCPGPELTGLPPGSYLVRLKADQSFFASSAATAVINAFGAAQEPTPAISIDFVNTSLTGFIPNEAYSINGMGIVPGSSLAIQAAWFGASLSIVKVGSGALIDSLPQTLPIPGLPPAPSGVSAAAETAAGQNDGKITGVTAAMEFRPESGGAWTPCQGTEVTGLAPGTYFVRQRAVAGYSFASSAAGVTVGSGTVTEPPTKPPSTDPPSTDPPPTNPPPTDPPRAEDAEDEEAIDVDWPLQVDIGVPDILDAISLALASLNQDDTGLEVVLALGDEWSEEWRSGEQTLTIPADALALLLEEGVAMFTLRTPAYQISLDSAAIASLAEQSQGGSVNFLVMRKEKDGLEDEDADDADADDVGMIPQHPDYDISVFCLMDEPDDEGNPVEIVITDLGDGMMTFESFPEFLPDGDPEPDPEPSDDPEVPEGDPETDPDPGDDPQVPEGDPEPDPEPGENSEAGLDSVDQLPTEALPTGASVKVTAMVRQQGEEPSFGDTVVLSSTLEGLDGRAVALQWQQYKDNQWVNLAGATETNFAFIMTAENVHDSWRLIVKLL